MSGLKTKVLCTVWMATLSLSWGCGKKEKHSCSEVAGHIVKMLRTELAKSDVEIRSTAQANLPTLQNSLLETCEDQNWPQSSRLCIINAEIVADTVACKPKAELTKGSSDTQTPEFKE